MCEKRRGLSPLNTASADFPRKERSLGHAIRRAVACQAEILGKNFAPRDFLSAARFYPTSVFHQLIQRRFPAPKSLVIRATQLSQLLEFGFLFGGEQVQSLRVHAFS